MEVLESLGIIVTYKNREAMESVLIIVILYGCLDIFYAIESYIPVTIKVQ